jgi:hypothetical protein
MQLGILAFIFISNGDNHLLKLRFNPQTSLSMAKQLKHKADNAPPRNAEEQE